MKYMEHIFEIIDEGARATFLQNIVHSFGCTYICLWSYLPQPSNWLISMDGFYNEENIKQPSSSSGSHAQMLFDHYRQSVLTLENHDRVPGFAFKNNLPYMELKGMELQRLASLETQLEFYREAMIKTAVFMGCMTGEIEMGFSTDTIQVMNLEMEMRKWITENFPKQPFLDHLPRPRPPDHQPGPSSSSSSLRSLSTDSTDPSPFLFSINPSTSHPQEPPKQHPIIPITIEQTSTTTSSLLLSPLHQAIHSFNQTRNNFPFLNPETEDDAITKAILAVLSSSSPSASPSSSQQSIAQNIPFNISWKAGSSAFKRYGSAGTTSSAHSSSSPLIMARVRRPSTLKRAISYFKSMSSLRNQERVVLQGSRPTSNQLYHMISERKRREKLNESFQALRSLLPPGTKKDKASVLNGTTEYLSSLRSQVGELTRRNQILEAQLLPHETRALHDQQVSESSSEKLQVRVTNVAETSSEARIIDLHVVVRGECNNLDLVVRLMEFLKTNKRVSFISMEADTKVVDSNSTHRVKLRLKIEGTEWDEHTFQEAVGRVVADQLEK